MNAPDVVMLVFVALCALGALCTAGALLGAAARRMRPPAPPRRRIRAHSGRKAGYR